MKNYSKMFQDNPPDDAENVIEDCTACADCVVEYDEPEIVEVEQEIEDEVEAPEEPIIGVVVNCTRLNVREEPNAKADIVCVIEALDEVMIEEGASTDDFYKIYTTSGLEGFCMKKFIVIREE